MLKIDGYKILAQIYESANSLIYRGIRQQDNQRVILKLLKEEYPTQQELTRYKQEHEILRQLNADGVIKTYGLEPYDKTLILILEDFGASSLRQLIDSEIWNRGIVSLPEFLNIAIKTVESLGYIHANNIIHKDINPANIVFNRETGQIKIIDFGISTILTRENPTLKNPAVLEGTLAYMSPGQTGRMNHPLDYRTDFYSLGVTFYELLTGQLPFTTTDPLELVHCHIAKQPVPPQQINPEITKIVADLVMKLMAKAAEDRYQSAWGIKADLETCLTQLETTGNISDFPLGNEDISDKFQIPQKLYGRNREVETLLAAFERVSQQTNNQIEMMLVAGYSGIGKSVLVKEIYKPITEKRGYFISGKFDQFQRNIPYSAVVSAFRGLVRQLLTESEDKLNQWRAKLLTAFRPNGQVIIDVIPEVELIVGKQPPVPELGPNESQNRLNFAFQNFIRVFCAKEHPLVIFLDDLQWADGATLKLIELMMTDAGYQYLFLMGAYRDNEVNPSHPLMMKLEELQKQGATINCITLAPLELEDINHLLADSLHGDIAQTLPLAELVVRKTGGNPFFVNEFLKTLHGENLLQFDFQSRNWQWDVNQIEAMGITDNVVELMIGKLKKQPLSTQQVLRLAACVGASFDLNTLAIVCEKPKSEIFPDLVTAMQAELILPLAELDSQLLIQDYKFLHDRVQQAAYALIDEEQKQAVHLQIGRLLWQNTATEELSEEIFEIVDHLNKAIEVVTSQDERDQIAKLNLIAGQKAKVSAAYGAAVEYLNIGLKLLSSDSWQTEYELTLDMHEEASEAAYLNGDFQQMEQLAEVVEKNAKTVLDKVKVYESKIKAAVSQGNLKQGVKIGMQGLKMLGVNLLEQPTQLDIQIKLNETASLLGGQEIENLINLPEMNEPEALAALFILASIHAASYIAAPEIFLQVACAEVNLSIKYGNGALSPLGYAAYGVIMCGIGQDIPSGYKLGKLALSLVERLNANIVKSKICLIFSTWIMHWKDRFTETVPILIESYQSGVETGDFEFAGFAAFLVGCNLYFSGNELSENSQKIATYRDAIIQIKRKTALNWNSIFEQAVLNLQGKSENPIRLMGDAYNEDRSLPDAIAANDRLGLHLFYLNKLILSYLFGEAEQAIQNAVLAAQYLDGVTSMIVVPIFHFYDSLAHLSAFPNVSPDEKEALLNRVNTNQEKMHHWADNAPTNYRHKFYLVEAEKARVLGQNWQATQLYERAISGARENGYIQEEALAYELVAKFYLASEIDKFAQTYMIEACYRYESWGATAKVKDLEAKYPQFVARVTPSIRIPSPRQTATNTLTGNRLGEALDLATVMKANQAISGEIMLDKLLASLMKILIENAGAQTGHLILEREGEWLIEASGEVNASDAGGEACTTTVLQSIPIENILPVSIINYVTRTKETVVKDDAAERGKFKLDPYIVQHQTKSILCAPLLNQGQLIGVLYLENNLVKGAFTPARLEVLQLLSGQAAISIENARLYQTLEDKVKERTAQLAQANQEINALNEKLKEENLRLSAELAVTKQLQQMILPKQSELDAIEGLEIAGFMEPADEVGGDYYDVLKQDGKVKISIGDVAGHGLESGVVMLMTQTAVRTLQESNQTDPMQFFDILNRTIYHNIQRINPYKNLTLSMLDYADGTIAVSGQHEEIIIVRRGGLVERIDTKYLGFPIGLDEEIADFIAQEKVHLNSGDVVVLYTDGITEAENINRELYGLDRLCEVVSRNCDRSAKEIRQAAIDDVRQHIGSQKVFDDITLVVLKQN